jgi:hypothetical protein
MDAAYVMCRTLGHSWDEEATTGQSDTDGRRLDLRCVRCTCERHDIIAPDGDLAHRGYKHPSGYRLTKDDTPDTAALRLELLKRAGQARRRIRAA